MLRDYRVFLGQPTSGFREVHANPPFLLIAGVMSAGLIIGSSVLIPRIGLGAFVVLVVTGQDHS
ncbi:DMT family transporter [uncultured Ruegeria sp.]|uniref:DMT family transporter n=1 Tax=uncultured Ruegeria sp. TaxID=259304 RepID=UPI00345358DC